MFIAALFTVAKTWKHPKRPFMDEQISKMWCIHTMEYHSVLKGRKFGHVWMDLEDIMVSEIS